MASNTSPTIKVSAFADHHVITPPNPLRGAVADGNKDDPIARAEKALADLSGEFKDWMSIECERLAAAHVTIIEQGFTAATRDELFRAAHDIKGDAATFGFPIAALAAESLCRVIEHSPDLDKVPDALIAHHINAIQAIVREHSRIEMAGMADELGRRLRGLADEYLTAVNHDRPEHLEAILAPSLVPVG